YIFSGLPTTASPVVLLLTTASLHRVSLLIHQPPCPYVSGRYGSATPTTTALRLQPQRLRCPQLHHRRSQ
ncbi:hypothetical protein A2U01_0039480, partial [Trifolium medium]|nr:hypothetical protein [Trifolium medium]